MGTADVHPNPILATIDQNTAAKLLAFPSKPQYLLNPYQLGNLKGAQIVSPPRKESSIEKITIKNEDADDIGFDGLPDPNPPTGLPPLDPVESSGSMQPQQYDPKNLIMPNTGYKRYLGKNQNAGKMRYQSLPKGVSHDQTALITTAVSNYLWQRRRRGSRTKRT